MEVQYSGAVPAVEAAPSFDEEDSSIRAAQDNSFLLPFNF